MVFHTLFETPNSAMLKPMSVRKLHESNMYPRALDVLITIRLHILCMLQVTLQQVAHFKISYKNFSSWFKDYSSSYTNLVLSMGLMLTIEKKTSMIGVTTTVDLVPT